MLCIALVAASRAGAQDAFADAIHFYAPGINGGFNADNLPDVILGPPRGGGATQGSLDVLALGSGGSIIARFDTPVICDGPGPDLTVFENAFHSGSPSGPVFTEYGFVAVSQDGVNYIEFPYDAVTHAGLAGQAPVLSNPDNEIDPLDPSVAGGDQFDLATLGLPWVAYVRVTDVGGSIADTGDLPQFAVAPNAGFDLDAIAALHACDPGTMAATPTPSATVTPTLALPPATATTTTTPIPHDVSVVGRRPLQVRVRRGSTDGMKRMRIKVRNLDATTDLPIGLHVTGCSVVSATVDFDRRTPGAQDAVVVRAGRTRVAIVQVTVQGATTSTPDPQAPQVCQLSLRAADDTPGSVDPTPANNTTVVELRLLDLNDVP